MDAKHRHELKTNELADWLTHAPDFLKRNASTIIGIALILIGLITWPMFSRMRQQRDIAKAASITEMIQSLEADVYRILQAAEQEEGGSVEEASNALLVSANALLDQADQTGNPDLQALAQIKAAQALRTELHLRPGLIDVEDVHSRIEQARQAYEKALAAATTPTLKAMATLGLGLCAEELGQRDQAAEIYQHIIDAPEFAATLFPAKARQRLAALNENLETFAFAPAPAAMPDEDFLMPDNVSGEMFQADPGSVFQTPPSLDSLTPAMPDLGADAVSLPTADSESEARAEPDSEQN